MLLNIFMKIKKILYLFKLYLNIFKSLNNLLIFFKYFNYHRMCLKKIFVKLIIYKDKNMTKIVNLNLYKNYENLNIHIF